MQQKYWLSLFLLLLVPGVIFAQSGKIRGTVTDAKSKEPLIGANIIVEATNMGASTDIEGTYLIINASVGTYSVKASYVGYRTITVSNVRVNQNLTTEVNFELSSEDVQVQTVEIVAERPLINKSATGAVRIIDNEFFTKLPSRGLDAVVLLQPGVVERNGNFYIRGGRLDETGFTLDGVGVKDIIEGGRSVSITAEAVEQVQVLTGGYTAEFGGASSGLVRSDLKTGSEKWKFSALGETDSYTSLGSKSLGGYSYGYSDVTVTAGGPLGINNLRFFGSAQLTKYGDPGTNNFAGVTGLALPSVNPRSWDGYEYHNVRMYATVTPKHPDDDDPLTNEFQSDTLDIIARPGNLLGGEDSRQSFAGTLSFSIASLTLKASGAYSANQGQFTTTTANILNLERLGKYDNNNGFASLKGTFFITPKTYIEGAFSYTFNKQEQYDPAFGTGPENIKLYGDSAANALHGYTLREDGTNFPAYQIILGDKTDGVGEFPSFNQFGAQVANYFLSKQVGTVAKLDFTSQINKNVEVKAGGEYTSYTYRRFNPASERTWVKDFKDTLLNPTDLSPEGKLARRIRNYGPDNLGYDVFGNEIDDDITYGGATLDLGPRKPAFGAGYLQSKIELTDIVLNLGLRYDYISSDGVDWVNPHNLSFVDTLAAIQTNNFATTPTFSYVSPRIAFSFPVTDRTVFYAQYGKFVQQPRLGESYRGTPLFYNIIKGGFFYANPAAFGIEPERTTSYELGFQQQIGENASFDISAFYKDIVGQVTYTNMTAEGTATHGGYVAYVNGDFATTKGLEFKLTLRRTQRVQASINYTLSDAKGTGSTPNAMAGAVGAPLGGGVFTPKYIVPLSFNQAHRGNITLDYRFAKNDGGPILEQLGLNLLAQFNSGTNFTRLSFNTPDNANDARFRVPIEEVGASTTPWFFQLDARLDKTFSVGPIDINVYVYVINLLGTDNATGAFVRTGDPKNDGWLGTSEGRNEALTYGTDAELYGDMYNTFNGGRNGATSNFGPPRQIRFGVKLEY
jgi:outer membrane receptor protein involved in Fe transport